MAEHARAPGARRASGACARVSGDFFKVNGQGKEEDTPPREGARGPPRFLRKRRESAEARGVEDRGAGGPAADEGPWETDHLTEGDWSPSQGPMAKREGAGRGGGRRGRGSIVSDRF